MATVGWHKFARGQPARLQEILRLQDATSRQTAIFDASGAFRRGLKWMTVAPTLWADPAGRRRGSALGKAIRAVRREGDRAISPGAHAALRASVPCWWTASASRRAVSSPRSAGIVSARNNWRAAFRRRKVPRAITSTIAGDVMELVWRNWTVWALEPEAAADKTPCFNGRMAGVSGRCGGCWGCVVCLMRRSG